MQLKVFTMPAALLLLLCCSCHQLNKRPALPAAQEEDKIELAPPAPPSSSETADTSRLMTSDLTASDEAAYKQSPNSPSPTPKQANAPKQSPVPAVAVNPDWEKKIIKTADLSIQVKSFSGFTGRLHEAVQQNGGYISREEQSQSSSSIENTVTIKIPVDRFDDLLLQLPADSDKLMEKKVSSEDVTMELIDTKSRLETKKEVRERYLDLLKQARSMKDILAIQEEIDGIQEETDAASGRIAYLSHSAAFSTVNLKFYQVLDGAPIEEPSPNFLHKIRLSFLAGWDWCSSVVLGLLSVWPLWLAAGLGWWGWRRHRARTTTTSTPSTAPAAVFSGPQ